MPPSYILEDSQSIGSQPGPKTSNVGRKELFDLFQHAITTVKPKRPTAHTLLLEALIGLLALIDNLRKESFVLKSFLEAYLLQTAVDEVGQKLHTLSKEDPSTHHDCCDIFTTGLTRSSQLMYILGCSDRVAEHFLSNQSWLDEAGKSLLLKVQSNRELFKWCKDRYDSQRPGGQAQLSTEQEEHYGFLTESLLVLCSDVITALDQSPPGAVYVLLAAFELLKAKHLSSSLYESYDPDSITYMIKNQVKYWIETIYTPLVPVGLREERTKQTRYVSSSSLVR